MIQHPSIRGFARGLAVLGIALGTTANAQLIPAANRIDMALDHLRGIVYISNGNELVRYRLPDQTVLAPLTVGSALRGMDVSPDGSTLAVADDAISGSDNFVHFIDLETLATTTEAFTRATNEGGTFSVAYGNDGRLLVSSEFQGSGDVPLRRYDPATDTATTLATVRQRSMLVANADRSIIAFEESNSSAGPFGRYRVSDGDLLSGPGTGWFLYEAAVNRDATQYAFPTFNGCYIYDGGFNFVQIVGMNSTDHPIGVVYHPTQDLLYGAWSGTSDVYALETATFTQVNTYNTGTAFNNPGNFGYVEGRLKISNWGGKLFCTVDNGVQLIDLGNSPPVGREDTGATDADQVLNLLASGSSTLDNDVDFDPGTTLTVTAFDATSAEGATVSVNGDGTFSYDPTASGTLQALATGNTLVDTFTYTVSDGTTTTVGTVSITITGTHAGTGMPVARPVALLVLVGGLVLAGLVVRPRVVAGR